MMRILGLSLLAVLATVEFVRPPTARAELVYFLRPVTGSVSGNGGVSDGAVQGNYTISGNGITTPFSVTINSLPAAGTTDVISFELYAAVVGRALNWKYQGYQTGNLFIQESGGSQTLNLVPDAGNALWQNGFGGQMASTGGPNNLYGSLTIAGSNFQDTNSQYTFPSTKSTTFGGLLNSGSGAAQEPWVQNGVSAAYFPGSSVESGGTIATIKLADVFYSYGSGLSAGTSTLQPLGFFSSSQPSTPAGHWIMDATKLPAPPSGGTNALVNYNANPASGPSSIQTGFGFMGSGFESTTAVTVSFAPAACSLSPSSISGIRVMQGGSGQTGVLVVSNSGGSTGDFQLSSGTGDALSFGLSTSGSLVAGATASSTLGWGSTSVTGSRSGQAVLGGLSPGDIGSPHVVAVTGAVVANRLVTAAPIVLGNGAPSGSGRFMATQSVGGSSALMTTGDDQHYTRITVNGTLFNSATTTSSYSLAAGTYAAGAVSGSIPLTVSGEGLAGESPVPVSVTYSGNALLNRVVTAAPIVLGNGAPSGSGRFMAGLSVGGTSALTTTGDDQDYTRITVNGTLFNSAATSSSYTLAAGTYAAGPVSGSIALAVSGEGLAGESPVPVSVAYSGDALLNRVVTAAPIVLGNGAPSGSGRFMVSQSVGGTSALSHDGRRPALHPHHGQRHALQLGHNEQQLHALPGDLCRRPRGWFNRAYGQRRGPDGREPRAGLGHLFRRRLAEPRGDGRADRAGQRGTLWVGPLHGQPERRRHQHARHDGRRPGLHPHYGQRHAFQLGHRQQQLHALRGNLCRRSGGWFDSAYGQRRGPDGREPCAGLGRLLRRRLAEPRGDGRADRAGQWGTLWVGPLHGQPEHQRNEPHSSTTGDDQDYTRITVNGTLFNSATTASSYTLAAGTYTAGPVSGSISLTVSGEGLAGESPVPVSVAYSGDALLNRVVTAAPIVLGNGAPSGSGRFMASQSVGGTSSARARRATTSTTPASRSTARSSTRPPQAAATRSRRGHTP